MGRLETELLVEEEEDISTVLTTRPIVVTLTLAKTTTCHCPNPNLSYRLSLATHGDRMGDSQSWPWNDARGGDLPLSLVTGRYGDRVGYSRSWPWNDSRSAATLLSLAAHEDRVGYSLSWPWNDSRSALHSQTIVAAVVLIEPSSILPSLFLLFLSFQNNDFQRNELNDF